MIPPYLLYQDGLNPSEKTLSRPGLYETVDTFKGYYNIALQKGPDGVEPRVKHGLSSKSTSARVACEPVVRIPVYYWLLSVVSSGGRGWYHLFWSVASASGTFLPVGLLLPTGRPFPPTSEPVISRQWTFLHSRRRHLSHWSDICFLLLPVASAGETDGSISAAKLSAMSSPQDTSSKADKAHQKPNMGASKKVTPAHKKGQSMRQKKRANRPTRKVTVCASKKGKLPHKKGYSSKCAPEKKWLFRDPQGHCQDSKPNQDR
ncbi:hypothetical protein PHYBLDRAFT_152300 [Phycomyces blakesleeanus NRRL 1555(-)]|uniref:Uncharacterized protein n=1 Tax=Phycomyces blakesleeanus (strain ATCC 8743b / DSM 1359 / FGSC 10004 / NBRC 33097 / NRRL 1555) TaxID=763407 RepID=A0A162TEG4_PHYB8|nr:hypothetical protein PHYBLDRAFT_152300 [Phycomyces blakesleeanus NRRL 1555(-)]OAD66493.1 hypothetical protein PHYBLDRAFT_152300 [Phycomyces blakesleeanus NRRL 1555(-)]|eukprot:XP_018284533.1 hypothetical protein PHYBLDRAFT_152300 [Phycomyces blakesleeanus NRRL 1555(-)]